MWSNQDFNQSGFGHGGGFSTSQADDKKRSVKRSNNVIPVTAAQMLTAKHEDDVFTSGQMELSQVTFVGLIKSVNESATRIDYLIDDMTGPPIEVRQFNQIDENEQGETPMVISLLPNTYVRVHGNLRAFGGKRTVNAHKIIPVRDMNELSCHMLEVVYANATVTQQQAALAGLGDSNKKGSIMDISDGGQIAGLTSLQSQIQMIIRSDQSERGCSIDEICQHLRSVAPKAIRDAIDFLSSEGHIYSTIDDEHYQATDG